MIYEQRSMAHDILKSTQILKLSVLTTIPSTLRFQRIKFIVQSQSKFFDQAWIKRLKILRKMKYQWLMIFINLIKIFSQNTLHLSNLSKLFQTKYDLKNDSQRRLKYKAQRKERRLFELPKIKEYDLLLFDQIKHPNNYLYLNGCSDA